MGVLNPVTNAHNYNPDTHIPDLSGKVILITGANSGIGKETVHQLAKHSPTKIYLSARSQSKYDDALKDLSSKGVSTTAIHFLELDLSSLASVKRAADQFSSENDRLDLLVNNAGIMAHPHGLTADGFEIQFGTNHMGHALLTKLLLPVMLRTAEGPGADVRIVDVSSAAHLMAAGGAPFFELLKTEMKGHQPARLYGQSKLANVLHARELARRYPSILTTSIHPGRVESNLANVMMDNGSLAGRFQKVFDFLAGPMSTEQGTLTQLWAATWKREEVKAGAYYVPIGKLNAGSGQSRDEALAKKLWEWQEAEFEKLGY